MNDEQWQELGRRAVACKAWRWMPGMLDGILYSGACSEEMSKDEARALTWPDLRDPATVGCLLALVREAWDRPAIYVFEDHGKWTASSGNLPPRWAAFLDTEAEALVAALEAAP